MVIGQKGGDGEFCIRRTKQKSSDQNRMVGCRCRVRGERRTTTITDSFEISGDFTRVLLQTVVRLNTSETKSRISNSPFQRFKLPSAVPDRARYRS